MFIRCTRWFKHVFALKNRNGQRLSAIPFTQRFKVISAAFIALWLVAQISEYSLRGTEHSLLLASMGASAVLLFGLPGSPLAKPAVFFWGHLLSAAIGLLISHLVTHFALMAALTHASASVLGKLIAIESRGIFPLKAQQAKLYCLDGLVLIGDAAHVIHPMAGQGVNLGCLDAAVLADALLYDRGRGLWAHRQTLKRYERERKLPNSMMMHGLSALGWLQSSDQQWMMWLRGEGMQILTEFDTLRLLISEEASGRSAIKSTRYHVTH